MFFRIVLPFFFTVFCTWSINASGQATPLLDARIIAVGVPGAGAVSNVGAFHEGGPIRDKPKFKSFTEAGRVLAPDRILVASSSNFGARPARDGSATGSVLSIDPVGPPLIVPQDFAAKGGQEVALDGRVRLFTGQSAAFLNGVNTPGAATADFPPVSNPLGISVNNAFGRLWFASAPQGVDGIGTLSIVDPGGQPLANAPSHLAGGVLAGSMTGRPGQQIIPGALNTGALATALLGMSPDGSKRAVFAVLTADGAIAQAHTEQALDGLSPPGTITSVAVLADPDTAQPGVTRIGMAFNWVPDRILYVTDPLRNAVVAITLTDDGRVFRPASVRLITSPQFDQPVDLAPTMPESANPMFSSNTSLAGGSDLYVANRAGGTIVRLRQDGTVAAVRGIVVPGDSKPLGPGRLNGIAVSPDGQRIWLTVSGALPGYENATGGSLVEVPAFGDGHADATQEPGALQAARAGLVEQGAKLFARPFTPDEGLGPLYNDIACVACHDYPKSGGVGPRAGLAVVRRVGRVTPAGFDPLVGQGGPVARAHKVEDRAARPCDFALAEPGVPPMTNVVSVRNAPQLFGLGLIDAIADDSILAGMQPTSTGHPQVIKGRIGRFGWKADVVDLDQMTAEAFRNELGLTSLRAPVDEIACMAGPAPPLELAPGVVEAVTAYVASLPAPMPQANASEFVRTGEAVFRRIGCAACHRPSLDTRAGIAVPLYSDLLLHDMGPSLDDGVSQGAASGADWRTTPLWGVSMRPRLLHDGRATSVRAAILEHDGEAAPSVQAFMAAATGERAALLAFLAQL